MSTIMWVAADVNRQNEPSASTGTTARFAAVRPGSGWGLSIGSRWVDGGSVINWPWHRELLSRAGNAYARVMLGLKVKDATAGFRAFGPGVLADIQAAVDYAAQTSGGKVGVVGYCWGGLLTWRAAGAVKGVSAAVPYYGGGVTSEAEIQRVPACPVQAHFGNKDHWIPLETVEAFKQAQPQVEVHVYEADHGFNCDHRGSYNEAAAHLALERALAFFAKHVG